MSKMNEIRSEVEKIKESIECERRKLDEIILSGNAEEICIRTRIVKGQADNFVTVCRGYFLVVADLDHVFIHVKRVLSTDI